MKTWMIILCFGFSLSSFATSVQEFDQKTEEKCYQEVVAMGCTDKMGEQVNACIQKKQAQLSPECKGMHKAQGSI